jgi:hypothetical protein
MPVDPKACVRISTFNWVPPFAQGYVRDLRGTKPAGHPRRIRTLSCGSRRSRRPPDRAAGVAQAMANALAIRPSQIDVDDPKVEAKVSLFASSRCAVASP